MDPLLGLGLNNSQQDSAKVSPEAFLIIAMRATPETQLHFRLNRGACMKA